MVMGIIDYRVDLEIAILINRNMFYLYRPFPGKCSNSY